MSSGPGPSQRPTRWTSLAVGLGLFALALAFRAVTWGYVFMDDRVMPRPGDTFYHLWRIAYGAALFPAVLIEDPYLNFAAGGEAHWGLSDLRIDPPLPSSPSRSDGGRLGRRLPDVAMVEAASAG